MNTGRTGPRTRKLLVDPPARWWLGLVACRPEDADAFSDPAGDWAAARPVCAGCTVRTVCLDWALTAQDTEVFAGGMSPEERRALTRPRRARKAA